MARIGCGIGAPSRKRDRSGVIRYSAFGASFSCRRPRRVAEAEASIEKPWGGTLARPDQPFRFRLGTRIVPNSIGRKLYLAMITAASDVIPDIHKPRTVLSTKSVNNLW